MLHPASTKNAYLSFLSITLLSWDSSSTGCLCLGLNPATHGYLMSSEDAPLCLQCYIPLTVHCILVECVCFVALCWWFKLPQNNDIPTLYGNTSCFREWFTYTGLTVYVPLMYPNDGCHLTANSTLFVLITQIRLMCITPCCILCRIYFYKVWYTVFNVPFVLFICWLLTPGLFAWCVLASTFTETI